MKPSVVRRRILRECADIHCVLDALEQSVREGNSDEGDEHQVIATRWLCEILRARFDRYCELQRMLLPPILRDADAWGELRLEALLDRLRRRRRDLELLTRFQDGDPRSVELGAVAMARYVRRDMQDERSELLDSALLRDDVVGIDVQTG